VRENGRLWGVNESFFVSGRFCVNRWKFRGVSEVSPLLNHKMVMMSPTTPNHFRER
jgi:hypothetical protein